MSAGDCTERVENHVATGYRVGNQYSSRDQVNSERHRHGNG